jgi:hypothetical protein
MVLATRDTGKEHLGSVWRVTRELFGPSTIALTHLGAANTLGGRINSEPHV